MLSQKLMHILGRKKSSTYLAKLEYCRHSMVVQVLGRSLSTGMIAAIPHLHSIMYLQIYWYAVRSKERTKFGPVRNLRDSTASEVTIRSSRSWRYRYILPGSVWSPLSYPFSIWIFFQRSCNVELNKCSFFENKIDYLGHVINPGRLAILDKTTGVIRELKQLTNVIELK